MSAPAFRIERRYGPVLKGIVFVILTAFVVADGIGVVVAWRDGLTGWLIASLLFALVLGSAWVMFVHRYLVRGVGGHYLAVDAERLVLGEVGGRVVHEAKLADIARVHYDHGNEMSTRVECLDGRTFTLNTIEIEREEFDALARLLETAAPTVRIERA